jgi:hypothetical protein
MGSTDAAGDTADKVLEHRDLQLTRGRGAPAADFNGRYYALGTIDFSNPEGPIAGYDVPAVGHGGLGRSHVVRLVAFPETGVVVPVQANGDGFEQIQGLVEALRDQARP